MQTATYDVKQSVVNEKTMEANHQNDQGLRTSLMFEQCYNQFSHLSYTDDQVPIVCRIHDAFGARNEGHHNCLGCNFAEEVENINSFLSQYYLLVDIKRDVRHYLILLYLFVERIETVIEILQVPTAYRRKYFRVFSRIRKWANFIKHPKSFVLTHHPDYNFEEDSVPYLSDREVIINDQFVDHYYRGIHDHEKQKKKNQELYNKLRNQSSVLVLYPNMPSLTKSFCYALEKVVTLISNNEVYAEILNDEATISDYFANEE